MEVKSLGNLITIMGENNVILTIKKSEIEEGMTTLRFCKNGTFEDEEERLIFKEYNVVTNILEGNMYEIIIYHYYNHYLKFYEGVCKSYNIIPEAMG